MAVYPSKPILDVKLMIVPSETESSLDSSFRVIEVTLCGSASIYEPMRLPALDRPDKRLLISATASVIVLSFRGTVDITSVRTAPCNISHNIIHPLPFNVNSFSHVLRKNIEFCSILANYMIFYRLPLFLSHIQLKFSLCIENTFYLWYNEDEYGAESNQNKNSNTCAA